VSHLKLETNGVLRLATTNRLQWEPSQGAYVLLYPEGMVKLSESAAAILKQIDGKRDTEAIVARLEAAYEGTGIRTDVIDFLSIAYDRGWITIIDR
jgi:pyrroloquinoline quinone biosynthesis protein D